MFRTDTYVLRGAAGAQPPAHTLVAAVIIVLFVLAAVLAAARKDVTQGFDEVAHASYVAHIQDSGDAWPDLPRMRLLDPGSFRFTGTANYLNHPPLFYALLAALGPTLDGHPGALLIFRFLDIALAATGLAALLGLGLAAHFSREEYYAYAVPLACIPVLVPLAGAVNNDNLGFVGGAVATLAVWQLLATDRKSWLVVALIGVVAASWAKLTGLLLTGAMVSAVIAYLLWHKRLGGRWIVGSACAFALAAAPYLVYLVQYGSPTPETPAQLALVADGARAAGWTNLPRKSFAGYVLYFIAAFVADWIPALGNRSAFNYAMLVVPVAALGCALCGIALSVDRLRRRIETPRDVVVIAGALAIGATLAIHIDYSYGRYVATGWLMDAYPRYYLPLAAIVPLAGLSLYAAIAPSRWRNALLVFLIAGPVLFRIFGAPLG